jgi:hypothetical protein
MGRAFSGAGAGWLLLLPLLLGSAPTTAAPWRLDAAADAPSWLSISGSYRVRGEWLDGAFRAGARGSDQLLAQRALVALGVTRGGWSGTLEIQDSRASWHDRGTPLGTDDVNALEPLQARVDWRGGDVWRPGDTLQLTAGRLTLDLGGRRLVARNQFRNTSNSFSGLLARWQGADVGLEAFALRPLTRLPSAGAALAQDEARLDRVSADARLAGLQLTRRRLIGRADGEVYVLALDEHDTLPARQFVTAGVRTLVRPAPGAWDHELEAAWQTGTLQTAGQRLDQGAGLLHLTVGRSFAVPLAPRLSGSLDLVGGDDDPDDGRNGQFSTLFGARRFDYGPTGIYGLLARGNLHTLGARVELAPAAGTDLMLGYRAAALAERSDTFLAGGLRDPSGNSGRFLGHQVEVQVGYNVVPGNLRLELGGAWLRKGAFLRNAPDAPPPGDLAYAYATATVTF